MEEYLDIYDAKKTFIRSEPREEFYRSIKKQYAETGSIDRYVRVVHIILMRSNGNILLQRRSETNKANAGLLDKTVGGHVSAGDGYDETAIRELNEEIGVRGAIVTPENFQNTIQSTNLEKNAILFCVKKDQSDITTRVEPKLTYKQPQYVSTYIGYYDGPFNFVDGEAAEVKEITLEKLKKLIVEEPSQFTSDICSMIDEFEAYIQPINP